MIICNHNESTYQTTTSVADAPLVDHSFKSLLKQVPQHLRAHIRANQYKKLKKHGEKIANKYVKEQAQSIIERLAPIEIKTPLPWGRLNRKDQTEQAAEALARTCRDLIYLWSEVKTNNYKSKLELIYKQLAERLEHNHVNMPALANPENAGEQAYIESIETALLKVSCDQWWKRKLLRMRMQCLEALQIALGRVKQNQGIYCSDHALGEWRTDQQRNRDFLNDFELENEEGDTIDLLTAFMSGVANPENRRIELMVRMRGLEELAEEQNRIGMFFTLTAPSKYHRTKNKGHHLNKKWEGFTPKDTQEYLCKLWAKVRSKWKREGIDTYGFRVVEPHTDGTPHWHLLLFFELGQADEAADIFEDYATKEDRHELFIMRGNVAELDVSPRFDKKVLDPNEGSATGYIAKYISKNIAVSDLELKNEPSLDNGANTGKQVVDTVERVRAWASRWNIRQFQQIGGEPVTIYRELRRIDELDESNILEPIRQAADNSRFAEFIKLMNKTPLNTYYEESRNQYNEVVKKIKGIEFFEPLITRLHEWTRKRKDDTQKENGVFPWTRGNNCTDDTEGGKSTTFNGLSKFERAIQAAGLDNFGRDLLLSGCQVTTGNGILKVRNGQLIHVRAV